jgi:TldD protein
LTSSGAKQFDARESLENLSQLFAQWHTFDSRVGAIRWLPTDRSFVLETENLTGDLSRLVEIVNAQRWIFDKKDFVSSSQIGIGLRSRSYIALSSEYAGGSDHQYYIRVFVMLTGERNGVRQEYFEAIDTQGHPNSVTSENIANMFSLALKNLESLLDGEPAPSGEMDIVIAAEAGGVIVHEAVGHGLEWDLQASSAYANQIGDLVANPLVTLVDDPTLSGLRGSYRIDHEGHSAERAVLIENGILRNYMAQTSSAAHLRLPHNGHGRRESYSAESIVRMGNTYIDNGPHSPEEIIASVENGIFVLSLGGWEVNVTSGDFVFKINFGYRIRNGKIAEVIRAANIGGNGPKMMREILMLGNDLRVGDPFHFTGGTCGKNGQGMPVTSANPTLKVRLKVTG